MLNRKITSVLLAVFLLVLGSAAYALPPKVSWSPAALNLPSLRPGESTTIKVVLTNASLLKSQRIGGGGLAFKVTNGAGTLITASASFPNNIEPGQKVNVALTLSVASTTSALPPRVISGQVQLVKPDIIFDKPLAVNFTVSPIPLPPDPGEEGKANLLGIDSDSNGVRDDIDRYIVFTYPETAKKREALKQEARAEQVFLGGWESKENTRGNASNRHRAWGCTWHIFEVTDPDPPNGRRAGYRAVDSLVSQLLNTHERITAFRKADHHLGGMVTHGPEGVASECSFDPASLPN